MCNDQEFLHKHRDTDPKVMPLGPARYLLDLAMRYYNEYRRPLSEDTVALAMETDGIQLRRNRTEPAMVRRVWRDLDIFAVSSNGLPGAREQCGVYLQRRGTMVRVEQATVALDRGDLDAAEDILRRSRSADDREEPVTWSQTDYVLAQARYGMGKATIPTGLHDLDSAWRGGFSRSELGMVAAPTGIGKSQILCAMAAQAFWSGLTVLYYTFELTKEQIATRITLSCLEKGLYDLRLDEMQNEWIKAARGKRVSSLRGDYVVREGPLAWPQLEEDLERWHEEHGAYPDLLILDSIDDMQLPGKFDAEWQGLKAAWRKARSVAQDKKIAIWSSSQLDKASVEKARVSLKNVAGAYAKATVCHYVIGCSQTPEEKIDPSGPLLNLYILKDSIHGTTGGWIIVKTEWGDGDNGYPGWNTMESRNLPLVKGNYADDAPAPSRSGRTTRHSLS